jgi:hypothetical protein
MAAVVTAIGTAVYAIIAHVERSEKDYPVTVDVPLDLSGDGENPPDVRGIPGREEGSEFDMVQPFQPFRPVQNFIDRRFPGMPRVLKKSLDIPPVDE